MNPADLTASLIDVASGIVARRGSTLQLTAADISLERSRSREHGDWASSIALKLAKPLKTPPRELAQDIADELTQVAGVSKVEVAGPGFLNVTLHAEMAGALAKTIVEQGSNYGRGDLYASVTMNLEFVSANPTGPIHIGAVRWAAVGDSLARVLQFEGAVVTKEYYFNDHGGQIDRFTRSLLADWKGEPTPDDGYAGSYIGEIASRVVEAGGGQLAALSDDEAQEFFRARGVELMFADIKQSLKEFGVEFDRYFHEDELHTSGAVERGIQRLRGLGAIFDKDGATWFESSAFGDDKDRVVIKSDGEYGYMSGDIAYYLNKRERGFERNLIMLGADHHGYIGRLMAMVTAFGDKPYFNLEILIGQMVNLVHDGRPQRMSKRAGTIVVLEDLLEAVGVDAGRYALVRSSSASNIDIDLDLWGRQTNDNPVYYVQYAYARTSAVARNAEAQGVDRGRFEPSLLTDESESSLLTILAHFPRVVRQAAEFREPHRIARYVEELAGAYHHWYSRCRVTPTNDEPMTSLHPTRLVLNDAAGQVLHNGLALLGVSAPDRM